ncbi:MAG: DNA-3-methyladenine glycosylase family protein [Flavitalea sp.]
MAEYLNHLRKDKKLSRILENAEALELVPKKNICLSLCSSIMSQQLSVKVAQVLYNRFIELLGSKDPQPTQITELSYDQLRGIGLSNAKVSYVQNVAQFAVEKGMDHSIIDKMENEEVINYLTEIKGVGRWTVEMLLMFTLARQDVFAIDDFGIQQAMIKLYKIDPENKKEMKQKMLKISRSGLHIELMHVCIYGDGRIIDVANPIKKFPAD